MVRSSTRFLVTFALVLAFAQVFAQPAPKVYRVGWLGQGTPPASAKPGGGFGDEMRELGYVQGRNLAIEYRYANGSIDKLPELAAELVRAKVDVIVASGEPAVLAAKRATSTTPIVMTETGVDPVKAGMVPSLARPGGNVTGLASNSEDQWRKRMGLLKEIAPKIARVAVVWNPLNPGNRSCLDEVQAAASMMGLRVHPLEVRDQASVNAAFSGAGKEPLDAVVICWDSATLENAGEIASLALKRRLPTIAVLREYVDAGALLSLGVNLQAQRRRSAHYVDRILKGAKPADIPVEQPNGYELIPNLSTAKALGLALPPSLLVAMDGYVP